MKLLANAKWARTVSMRPPVHLDDLAIWIRPDGVLVAETAARQVRWTAEGFQIESPMMHGSLDLFGDRLLISTADNHPTHWVDARTGRVLLRRDTGDFFHGPNGSVLEDDGRTLYEVAPDGIRHPRFKHSGRLTVKWIGENLVVALDDCIAIGLDLTGREVWRTNVERPSNQPNVDSYMVGRVIEWRDLLVLPIGIYGFIALRTATGELVWDTRTRESAAGQTAIRSGDVLRWLTSYYIEIALEDGRICERRDLNRLISAHYAYDLGNVVEIQNHLVAVGSTGNAIAYDVGADRFTWSHQLGARSASNCVTRIAHDKLWLIDLTGKLHVFEIAK